MASRLKRSITTWNSISRPSSVAGSISPPPIKRCSIATSLKVGRSSGEHHNLRIFSWNVNGVEPLIQRSITAALENGKPVCTPLRAFLQRHGWPEVLCLQEVKIRKDDIATQRKIETAVQKPTGADGEMDYVVRYCLPSDKHNAKGFGGKIYGVASIIREDIWSDIRSCREVDWDREGRVLVLETNYNLAILNIYAVNGTDNPYKDPKTGSVVGTRHDRKSRFHDGLLQECLRLEDARFDVLLVGDMNVAPDTLDSHPSLRTIPHQHALNRADFNERFLEAKDGLQGVDVFRYLHGNTRKYTYYPRNKEWGSSCDRVDLIIASKRLAGEARALLEADIFDSPRERCSSDHVPLFVTLDRDKLKKSVEL